MTAAPTWSILVPTLGERRALFERMLAGLLPQLDAYAGRVQVIGWHNNGSPSLPKIRATMLSAVTTDYVSFIDDDDLVAPYFADEIMAAIETRPDYVGFQVQCYSDDHPIAVSYHSLEYPRWQNLKGRFFRDISHINPMLTRHARRGDFLQAGKGRAEDRIWASQIRRANVLKRQVMIPRIMYHYLYSTSTDPGQGSRWEKHHRIHQNDQRSAIDSPHFTWSPHA